VVSCINLLFSAGSSWDQLVVPAVAASAEVLKICAESKCAMHCCCHGLQMNVRSLCFARVARDQGEPWLWWEYADQMGQTCRMSDKTYNAECSEKVGSSFALPFRVCVHPSLPP
jgi:hypothetical protein